MLRGHPLSTLFPYTTLFRSIGHQANGSCKVLDRDLGTCEYGRSLLHGKRYVRDLGTGCISGSGKKIDRKSTRLNSSHVEISYAVFCLKKKKPSSAWRRCRQC